ncbi:MAG: hypothetical protein WCR42_03205 [bacterium]
MARGRKPLITKSDSIAKQVDVKIGEFYNALQSSGFPESEIAFIHDITHEMNKRSMDKAAKTELLNELTALYKSEKARVKAELESSDAFTMIKETAADINRAETEFNILSTKYIGYLELIRGRITSGEHVPDSVQKLLNG